MQGNWTVKVKSKEAAFPQRFVIAGATTGNGTYNGTTALAPVNVTGRQWSIAILNDAGTGFRLSDTRIKFPTLIGGNFVFDIESNDAGGDNDFNDLILTCTAPAMVTDYLIYGNVTLYSGNCYFNPCNKFSLVIDTYASLLQALKIDKIKDAIKELYPERIPIVNPNPPDPPPFFTPLMINLTDEIQMPEKTADVFNRNVEAILKTVKNDKLKIASNSLLSNFSLAKTVSLTNTAVKDSIAKIDRTGIAKIIDGIRFRCSTEAGSNLTLNFAEYDRSSAELAGAPYSGNGNRTNLGNAITDMNGNYIFRFTQSFEELANEIAHDVATGENVIVQARPDIIVSVSDVISPSQVLFETVPYFNIPPLRRLDLCLPRQQIRPASLCFNGNLIGSLGNVFIGGNQNTAASLSATALNRDGYNNHLRSNGKITVHNTLAGFNVDCACWGSLIDVKGCMFNLKRKKTDPIIRHYTIRYKKLTGSWQFVTQSYRHPKFSKRNIPFYNGDLVGPFPTSLKVDGGAAQIVSAYKNIQAETYFDGVDWEFANLDRYMQLNSGIYEAGQPGIVYFLVEGYDSNGNLVPNAKDLIALYINNKPLEYGFGNLEFTSAIEKIPCGLYKLTAAEMNTPLSLKFKAFDAWGFTDSYTLTIGKCPQQIEVNVTNPASIAGIKSTGILAQGNMAANADANGCPGYYGTLGDFGTSDFVTVNLQPSAAEGGWLRAGEQFGILSFGLTAAIRRTNGYNSGIGSPNPTSTAIYLQPK